MKKTIVLFRSRTADITASSAHRIVEGLNERNLDVYEETLYENLVVSLDQGDVQAYVSKDDSLTELGPDFVYLHGFSHTDVRQFIAHYCDDKHIPFTNTENKYTSPTSKLNQYYAFAKHGVPYPRTIVSYPNNIKKAVEAFKLQFPFIVKSINGRGGNDNFLARDDAHLSDIIASLAPNQAYALQPFIENDGDYRVIVFGDRLVACYLRSRTGEDHRNNVLQGARRLLVDPVPEEIQSTAFRAAESLRRELTGIDVIIGRDGNKYVLESNFNFGLKDNKGDEIVPYVLDRLAVIMHEKIS